jgi:hypothetical protein
MIESKYPNEKPIYLIIKILHIHHAIIGRNKDFQKDLLHKLEMEKSMCIV